METVVSLPHTKLSSTCPYPEPDQSSPCLPSHFLNIHFNISLPSTSRTSKWCLLLRSPHRNPLCLCVVCWRLFCMLSVSVSILYAACWSQYFVCSLVVLVFCMQCASVGTSFAICRCWYFACYGLLFGAKTC